MDLPAQIAQVHDEILKRGSASRHITYRFYERSVKKSSYDVGERLLLFHPPALLESGRKPRVAWLGLYRILALYSTVSYNLDSEVGTWRKGGVFSADCVLPATDITGIPMAELSPLFATHGDTEIPAMYTTDPEDIPIFVREPVLLSDDRAHGSEFTKAKEAEIRPLLERETFEINLREEVPKGKRYPTVDLWLVSSKDEVRKSGTKHGQCRNLAEQAFAVPAKLSAMHNYSNVRHNSCRMLLALASIFGF